MEQKNRTLVAILVTILIVAAMFFSFGRSLFTGDLPQIVLPDNTPGVGTSDLGTSTEENENQFLRVEVNPGTVQSVIASLSRNPSYYRTLIVENHWSEELSTTTNVQVWVDNDWSHIIQTLPSGLIRHDVVGNGQIYFWYDGEKNWMSAPADERSADLAQHIPTYETVLDLETESITATGYELQGDIPCIYVQAQLDVDGYESRYWISVDSGLLVRAETLENGVVIYSMSALTPIQSPGSVTTATFTLPDGTVLHTP